MSDSFAIPKKGLVLKISLIIIVLLIIFLPVIFFDKIALLAINSFSGCTVTASDIGMPGPGVISFKNVTVKPHDKELIISADEAAIDLDLAVSMKEKALVVNCYITNARVEVGQGDSLKAMMGSGIADIIFGSDKDLYNISFSLKSGAGVFGITSFKMNSSDISVGGEYLLDEKKPYVYFELKINISPQLYNSIPSEVKSAGFSQDEKGWYGTILSYKGNPMFLKALYAITS